MEEMILVVKQKEVAPLLSGEGFLPVGGDVLQSLVDMGQLVPRSTAEGNPELRQLIPYTAIVSAGQVFTVTRTRAQSESRLHHKLSIGIGGHIHELDVLTGALRELHEELAIGTQDVELIFLGLINDISTPVSRDHLGCLFVTSDCNEVTVREVYKMRGEFQRLAVIRQNFDLLESWSQVAIDILVHMGHVF